MGEDGALTPRPGPPRIALVGDYQPAVVAHQGIDRSLSLAAATWPSLEWEWIHTASLDSGAAGRLEGFSGVWLVPASPYASESGALGAITHARTGAIPFLGTCGGFQHALLEYARVALGMGEAGHAETAPGSAFPLIAPLSCSLVERSGAVLMIPGTRLRAIYGEERSSEGYHCNYGLNPFYESLVTTDGSPLRISARDEAGDVRAFELSDHPFFIATLFQPERRALTGALHPIVRAFIEAQVQGRH